VLLHPKSEPTGTILVADDQASNRELLEELLTRQGFTVIAVSDGAEALNQLSKVPVDLVILDVLMPHMNGFEVCRKIKANPETYLTPVVLVTALSDKHDRIEGLRASADDFLPGRWTAELLARVQSLIKLKQRTDELERAESVLFALARSIEGKDPYTGGHCERLAEYSASFGTAPRSRGRTDYPSAERRSGSRYRKNRGTEFHHPEAGQPHPRGMEAHA